MFKQVWLDFTYPRLKLILYLFSSNLSVTFEKLTVLTVASFFVYKQERVFYYIFEVINMEPNLNWKKDFQEFQEILNSGINPEWLYSAKANMILNPAYTGEGRQFFFTKDIMKASKTIPFF